MSEWKLRDCCLSISDGDHLPPPKSDCGIPFITISNIDSTNHIDFSNTLFVPEEYYDKLDSIRKAQPDDIIYSVVGSFGKPVLIKENKKFVFQRHIAILRPNNEIVDSRYLYYIMLSRDFYMQADSVAVGAAQRTISLTSLRNMKVNLPEVSTQHRIATILSRYDSLIENYQKQIKLLEESAQRLYKEWFIDLRFPGHENTKIVDGVPEGWEKKKINEIALLKAGGDKPEIVSENRTKICNIPIYSNGTSNEGLYGYTDNPEITEHCVTISARGSVGYTVMRRKPFVPIVRLISVIPQSIYVGYLYFYIKQIPLDSNGAAQQQITIPMIRDKEIIIPTNFILDELERCLEPMFKHIDDLKSLIRHLTEARDRLLPKLMSEEIKIN